MNKSINNSTNQSIYEIRVNVIVSARQYEKVNSKKLSRATAKIYV